MAVFRSSVSEDRCDAVDGVGFLRLASIFFNLRRT